MVRHSSRIELRQSALQSNINFLKKKIGKDVRFSSVVKANAYGHGIRSFVPMAEKCGIEHFSVASSFEAEEVLAVKKPSTKVMIMGILYDEDLEWAIAHDIEFYVFSVERIKYCVEIARILGKKALLHLEVETGANRTGMLEGEFRKALTQIKKHSDHLEFVGMCTHFGGAENFSNRFKIESQHKRFKQLYKICKSRKVLPKYRHLASSAATLAYPETRYEMVRVGVAQYGFWPSPEIYYDHLAGTGKTSEKALRRIFTWKTDVMDVRPVNAGEFIGYGTAFQATHEMTIAVLPLGYSNGYPRAMSNSGYVLIHGKKCRIVGLINMNLFMVDVTHLKDVEIGDEVVLIGSQKNTVINVASFTNSTQLLNQEMMSRLPSFIPREAIR